MDQKYEMCCFVYFIIITIPYFTELQQNTTTVLTFEFIEALFPQYTFQAHNKKGCDSRLR